jgi:hypothetical protein
MAPLASKGGNSVFGPLIKAQATATRAVLASESGVTFTTRGATAAVTFTLPAVTDLPIGTEYTFYGVSAYGFVVASNGSSDNIIGWNDATSDTITVTTTSLIIGASIRVMWDGTSWLAFQGAAATYVKA